MNLSPPTLLDNTRQRFYVDKIYTYVGAILVAVNPFKGKAIPAHQEFQRHLYGPKDANDMIKPEPVMVQYVNQKIGACAHGPHTYAMSERAFLTMVKGTKQGEEIVHKNQAIIVSGESGAGKTQNSRYLLQYLVWRGASADATDGGASLNLKIVRTNPILEAYVCGRPNPAPTAALRPARLRVPSPRHPFISLPCACETARGPPDAHASPQRSPPTPPPPGLYHPPVTYRRRPCLFFASPPRRQIRQRQDNAQRRLESLRAVHACPV